MVTVPDIAEVVESGRKGANVYLNAGYVLLEVTATTRAEQHPVNPKDFWFRRDIRYVLGRPRTIPAIQQPTFSKSGKATPPSLMDFYHDEVPSKAKPVA